MPVASLNQEVCCEFSIHNNGYENEVIKNKIVDDFSHFNLQLIHLNDPILSATNNRINFLLKFKSDTVISFTTKIQFYDSFNQEFSLPVSATADNCQLTNWLDAKQGEVEMKNQKKEKKHESNFHSYWDLGNLDDEG